jgi:hypothetical protein
MVTLGPRFRDVAGETVVRWADASYLEATLSP